MICYFDDFVCALSDHGQVDNPDYTLGNGMAVMVIYMDIFC